jgi:prepilin-type N-terminal cleavage/methylation domain-containing protein/prepilin-type processing-associated H-X9-DG protein
MTNNSKQSGFTLVEMLVVIAIIGILVALLLPAINYAREAARQTQCLNNQQELGKAIISYEGAKGRLPGIVNRANPSDTTTNPPYYTNWVMSLFDSLGRNDLMNYWRNGIQPNTSTLQPVQVDGLICPSSNEQKVAGGLSYMVNLGVYQYDTTKNPKVPIYTGRLFRNRASVPTSEPDFSFVNLNNSTRTIMLSENIKAGPWNSIPTTAMLAGEFNAEYSKFAFPWPQNIAAAADTTIGKENDPSAAILSSYHRGKVVVTFCDGHSEALPIDTKCWNPTENMAVIYGTP